MTYSSRGDTSRGTPNFDAVAEWMSAQRRRNRETARDIWANQVGEARMDEWRRRQRAVGRNSNAVRAHLQRRDLERQAQADPGVTSAADAARDAALGADLGAGADFIDVDPGFRPIRQPRPLPADAMSGRYSADRLERMVTPQEVSPLYRETDPANQLNRMSPEARRSLQLRMQAAGFDVELSDYVDPVLIRSMRQVMGFANMNGMNWSEGLTALQKANIDAKESGRTEAAAAWAATKASIERDVYLAPSYETMAEDVKSIFRQRLGREPKDYEIELLSEELSASHKAAFDQEQDIVTAMALRAGAQQINAQYGEGSVDVPGRPADGVAVDPVANFRTKFDELYAGELATEKAEDDHQATTARLINGLTGIDRMFS